MAPFWHENGLNDLVSLFHFVT